METHRQARFLLKIDSFSKLSDNGIDKYKSSAFESSGHEWKVILYPKGNGDDGRDHISVYLAIFGTGSLPADWEVIATFSFLVFDQIHDNFVVMRGMERRFRSIKTEWGFSKCISCATFEEPSNGYLVNDKCVFGIDVYVTKNKGVGEYMSLSESIESYEHEGKIYEFTKLKNELFSEVVGNYKWKLSCYPTGNGSQSGLSISIFLELADAKVFDRRKRVLAKFIVSVKDQISGTPRNKKSLQHWFSATDDNRGWTALMPLSEVKDPKKGFLANDCCIVEAEISVLRIVNDLI